MTELLADRYASRSRDARTLHQGARLVSVVNDLMQRLPPGRVWIVSTSLEGSGVAAACAALAGDREISWDRLNLTRPVAAPDNAAVVVIEPSDPGSGWRSMVARHLPHAEIVILDQKATVPRQRSST